ncbi:sulfate ABC transporter permease subunit CysT [Zavarzinia sp. CC-PAN008]|uniref:sulfate ABC transporter permease subunit CysT n=1 Tax=Zavarzinia sp. CC-PAN008 TaxID=3243332 RepID=UPI003F748B62
MAGLAKRTQWRQPSVIPGFGLTLGYTLTYLGVIVLIPMAALILRPMDLGLAGFWAKTLGDPRVVSALWVSFGLSFLAALLNLVFGLLVAWVLVRYSFPGKRVVDAIVDLPFALPTAVAGLALSAIYAPNGWLGSLLAEIGIKAVYNQLGIFIALTFIGLPFVVRTVQPVLQDMNSDSEEAAISLGATRFQAFARVIFPAILPALLTGFALAFARGVGEYGSVIFIAGNMPLKTEIAPLLIVIKLEQFDYAGAAAIGVVMLLISFVILFFINLLQRWGRMRAT